MLAEPAPKPIAEPGGAPLDVVVLVVPDGDTPARLVDAITEITRNGTAAVLVVFPNGGDAETLRRITAAGANYARAPSSTEMYGHMQRARADARHRRSGDDPLDTLWRSRAGAIEPRRALTSGATFGGRRWPMAEQFHFHPDHYLEMVRSEVPDYELLQTTVADAASEVTASSILDLGTGTGQTLHHVALRHPAATLVGVDESEDMLAAARELLPGADLRVARLQDELPEGSFDVVVSALAVHHLDAGEKADLFGRIADRLAPRGRFILADVVVPDDPADAVTPIDAGYDLPSRAEEQLQWLRDASLHATLRWQHRDLAVIVAERGD